MGKIHRTDIQIRFADADILGHINNVNMLHYFDLGKTHFYTEVMHSRVKPDRKGSILVSVNVDYLEQTFPSDDIYVETMVEKIGTKSITFIQQLINRQTGKVNARCRTVAVTFDYAEQQSIEVTPEQRKLFGEYLVDSD